MNLTFGICWIEDQAADAEIDAVQEAVRQNGFEPDIHRVEKEEEIRSFVEIQKQYHDFDLILLDLRLGGGLRGNELATQIRENFRSTPILFYSGEAEDALRTMMCDKRIEGVYCAHRDRLATRVAELVDALTPALNRLSSMRGLAARVVAECDQELRTILLHLSKKDGSDKEIVDSLKQRLVEAGERQKSDVQALSSLPEMLGGPSVPSGVLFTEARERARAENGTDDVRDLLRSLRDYKQQVLWRRNALAHALEERTDNGWVIHRVNAKPLTVSDFERYRRDFLSNLRDLRQLRALLIPEKAE